MCSLPQPAFVKVTNSHHRPSASRQLLAHCFLSTLRLANLITFPGKTIFSWLPELYHLLVFSPFTVHFPDTLLGPPHIPDVLILKCARPQSLDLYLHLHQPLVILSGVSP